MAGPSASRASRRLPYSGTYLASLRRRTRGAMPWMLSRKPFALAAVLSLGLLNGGCAVSGMFGIGKDDALARAETTGSIPPGAKLSTGLPPEVDLAYTRAAIGEVLSTGRKDFSTAWENPSTGARGTVTPIATAYDQDGMRCHDFLASYLHGRAETWMRGEACQDPKGRWEVKILRPWKRT